MLEWSKTPLLSLLYLPYAFEMANNQLYSIVFVHGWKADANHPSWTSTQLICWPEQLIPAKIPEARILSYNYECQLNDFWNDDDDIITDHSNDMLDQIMDQRTEGNQVGVPSYDQLLPMSLD